MKASSLTVLAASTLAALCVASLPARAADAAAAQELIKSNKCTKCHAADKDKNGPSFKKIADKYRGKAEGEQAVIKNLTTSPKVKLDDGTEEEHKQVKVKDPAEIKNLAQYILSH